MWEERLENSVSVVLYGSGSGRNDGNKKGPYGVGQRDDLFEDM